MLTGRSKRQRILTYHCVSNSEQHFSKTLALNLSLQVIPRDRRRLFCVSGIHRERKYGSTTSTRPITVHERTAMCKSQLEPIIESTGNTRGAEQAIGR